MRLAIDASRSDIDAVTGTERYSREIVQAITQLDERPSLTLYTRGQSSPHRPGDNIDVVQIERSRLWTHVGLSRALLKRPPDALFVPSHVIPALHPPVSVVTVHDLGYLHQPEAHPRRQRLMLDATTRWNVRAAARVIAISEETRRDLVERYGADADRIDVVYHGIDHEHFRPLDENYVSHRLRELGISRKYVLFVSTLQPRKNLVRLVEGFEMLGDAGVELIIAGKPGWGVAPIMRRIAFSPKAHLIRVLGHVDDADLPLLYNGASVFVLPSLYEGFGMGIVEAMACGCPVVTSDRSSLPEIAGDAAVLADPLNSESISEGIRCVLDVNKRQILVERGLQRASEFRWDRAARQTLRAIQRAVRDARG